MLRENPPLLPAESFRRSEGTGQDEGHCSPGGPADRSAVGTLLASVRRQEEGWRSSVERSSCGTPGPVRLNRHFQSLGRGHCTQSGGRG